jgi:hypothetical protein
MKLEKYVKPELWHEIVNPREIRVAETLLEATEAKKRELQEEIEKGRVKVAPEKLDDHLFYKLGMIAMANWILELPDHARKAIEYLPD